MLTSGQAVWLCQSISVLGLLPLSVCGEVGRLLPVFLQGVAVRCGTRLGRSTRQTVELHKNVCPPWTQPFARVGCLLGLFHPPGGRACGESRAAHSNAELGGGIERVVCSVEGAGLCVQSRASKRGRGRDRLEFAHALVLTSNVECARGSVWLSRGSLFR